MKKVTLKTKIISKHTQMSNTFLDNMRVIFSFLSILQWHISCHRISTLHLISVQKYDILVAVIGRNSDENDRKLLRTGLDIFYLEGSKFDQMELRSNLLPVQGPVPHFYDQDFVFILDKSFTQGGWFAFTFFVFVVFWVYGWRQKIKTPKKRQPHTQT